MDRKKKFYSDILFSISLIRGFVKDTPSFDSYTKDLKTKSAVERQLVIIGEAVNYLIKNESDSFTSAQQMISFRNRLVHAYDSIDDTIVWTIIQKYLEDLKKEVEVKFSSST